MIRFPLLAVAATACSWLATSQDVRAEDPLHADLAAAARRATDFFRSNVGFQGSYVWQVSADLRRREGEGKASASTGWVQPPGTPSVGEAYLRAYHRTRDRYYLEAAKEVADVLVRCQLKSGGWDYRIELAPGNRRAYAYRADGMDAGKRNTTTLDDNNTQSALRLLMRVDQALDMNEPRIHEVVQFALERLLEAQYPNGAWPQRFAQPPNPNAFPVIKASYPEQWARTFPGTDYRAHYTLNDNTIEDMITTMLEASDIYGEARYRESAERAGDFLILAQMPDPQPAWAQQYDRNMHPAWARKFEPPAITGGESHGALRSLLRLYHATGEPRFLEPIPRALEYFRHSKLDGNRLARFYELESNRPLYFTTDYQITYLDDDLPTHYGFKTSYWVDSIAAEYEQAKRIGTSPALSAQTVQTGAAASELAARARGVLDSLDTRGCWIEEGRLLRHGKEDPTRRVIRSKTFIRNLDILTRFLESTHP
jgi:PelA/Pel-15E family pectate lyase